MASIKHPRHTQQGVAALTAMFIVFLAATIAVAVSFNHMLDIRRTGNMLGGDQASRIILSAEIFIKLGLQRDRQASSWDHAQELWAKPVTLPIDEGTLKGQLKDAQGCFNLNNLRGTGGVKIDSEHLSYKQFQRLLDALELDSNLVNVLADWLDSDQDLRAGGAEDNEYYSLQPPRRSSGQAMASLSELYLIQGMTDKVYQKLLPHVCALPQRTAVNINTASIELLQSLADGIDRSIAELLYQKAHEETGFEKVEDFTKEPTLDGITIDQTLMSTQTEYFISEALVTIGDSRVQLYSLFHRDEQGVTTVLSRSRGVF